MAEKKYKLPRKRKKAYIKARGKRNYAIMCNWFLPSEKSHVFPKEVEIKEISLGSKASTIVTKGRW